MDVTASSKLCLSGVPEVGPSNCDPQIGGLETSSEPPKPSMKEVETGSTMVFPAWAPHTGAAGAANRQGNGAKLWMSEAGNRLIWEGRGSFRLWVFSGNGSRHHP